MSTRVIICVVGYAVIIATQFIYEWKWFEWSGPAIVELQKTLTPEKRKAWDFFTNFMAGGVP
jgi:hypothetical protein